MARYRVGLETRERILRATRELLAEVGVEGVTLKAITDRAGVGAGSFYNLFDSKESVVLEVVREAIAAVDPDPEREGRDTLADLIGAYVKFMTTEPGIARIYLQMATASLTDERMGRRVLRSHRRRVERFRDAIARAHDVPAPEAEREAEHVLAALTGFALTWFLDPTFDFHGHAAALAEPRPAVAGASD